jgi:hypothetical protein
MPERLFRRAAPRGEKGPTMSDERHDVRDEAGDAFSSAAAGRHRRALLGTAAGGLVLAASGLLLPEWLVAEAEAAEHPVRRIQHRSGQKRSKRRHRREHRREVHRRQNEHDANNDANQDKPPKGLLFEIKFHVQNLSSQEIAYQVWDQKDEVFDHSWHHVKSGQIPPNPTGSLDDKFVVDYMGDYWPGSLIWVPVQGIMVSAQNVAFREPLVVIGSGGSVSTDGWTNGKELWTGRMPVGQTKDVYHVNPRVQVYRNEDYVGRKFYSIKFKNV